MPTSLPSAAAPKPIFWIVRGRYPTSVNICSRVSVSFTGRLTSFAACTAAISCGQVRREEPKAPPTNRELICTLAGSSPKAPEIARCEPITPWDLV